MSKKETVACGVPWCVALADGQYCKHHADHPTARTHLPPPVTRELEKRYEAAARGDDARL